VHYIIRIPQIALLLCVVKCVPAAEVLLDNGDRLTGTVINLEGNTLRFQTDYAGVLKIDWNRVARLTTEQDVIVLTDDDQVLQGRVSGSPKAGIQIITDDGEVIEQMPPDVAMINPEDWRIGRAVNWSGKLNVSVKADRGNADKDEIDFDTIVALRRKDDRFEFRADLEYDTSFDEETKQKWDMRGNYDYFVSEKLYYAANAALEHDKFKGLKLRYHLGPAVGYQFFEQTDRNLRAEVGAYYTSSDIDDKGRNNSLATGWLVDFDYRFDSSVFQTYHWQSMILSSPENMNFKSRTGLRVPLGGDFLGSAEVEANWDAETAADSDKTEIIYRLKVGYGW